MKEHSEITEGLREEILENIRKCVKCRFCFTECPVYQASDGWITSGSSGMTQALYYGVLQDRLDEGLRDILIRCTTCRSCEILCERLMAGVPLVDAIRKGRRLLMEAGVQPVREQQRALEFLQQVHNPYGMPAAKRTLWAEGMDVPRVGTGTDADTLYFVGCTTAYDERAQAIARAMARIMARAGMQYGILENETCCGDPADVMGEAGLFDLLTEAGAGAWDMAGIERIVASCPHGLHLFLSRSESGNGGRPAALHHTQLLQELLEQGALAPRDPGCEAVRVTYHDPCYLSKHRGIVDAPRAVLNALPGVELCEMPRNREKSFCCGGGGGRVWVQLEDEQKLSELRVQEALDTGATRLVTACPFCLQNLEDAVKTLDAEDAIQVLDIAELTAQYL